MTTAEQAMAAMNELDQRLKAIETFVASVMTITDATKFELTNHTFNHEYSVMQEPNAYIVEFHDEKCSTF